MVYRAVTEQEMLEEQILDIVDNADSMTRSDLQSVVMAVASKYMLIEDLKESK